MSTAQKHMHKCNKNKYPNTFFDINNVLITTFLPENNYTWLNDLYFCSLSHRIVFIFGFEYIARCWSKIKFNKNLDSFVWNSQLDAWKGFCVNMVRIWRRFCGSRVNVINMKLKFWIFTIKADTLRWRCFVRSLRKVSLHKIVRIWALFTIFLKLFGGISI